MIPTPKPIAYDIEAGFLRTVVERCDAIRQAHDTMREEFSSSINELFNTKWIKSSEPIKRGAMIGALKSGESVLNETQAHLFKLRELLSARIRELEYCHAAIMLQAQKKKRKGG
jgi:hypothetical protein